MGVVFCEQEGTFTGKRNPSGAISGCSGTLVQFFNAIFESVFYSSVWLPLTIP